MAEDPTSSEPSKSSKPTTHAEAFDAAFSADVTSRLKASTSRGGMFMIGSSLLQALLAVGSLIVLARLLDIADFGLMAMVNTLLIFIATFRDFGLSMALVQKPSLTHAEFSRAFHVNAVIGLVVAGAVAALAPALGLFYQRDEVHWMTLAVAPAVLLMTLGLPHMALLRRQMQFARVALIELLALAISVGVSIWLAFIGWGYWALLLQQAIFFALQPVGAWMLCPWRPAWTSNAQIRSMLNFGGGSTASRTVNYLARQLDQVLIGAFSGPIALGLYQKAVQLARLPQKQLFTPLLGVSVSGLSKMQHDADRYRTSLRRGLGMLFTVIVPAFAVVSVAAEDVVVLLLGPDWAPAVPLLRILAIGQAAVVIAQVTKWVYLSEGRTTRGLVWTLIAAPVTIAAVSIGAAFGSIGIAIGYAASAWLLVVPAAWFCTRGSRAGTLDLLLPAACPIFAACIAGGVTFAIQQNIASTGHALSLLRDVGMFTVQYLAASVGFSAGRQSLHSIVSFLLTGPGNRKVAAS